MGLLIQQCLVCKINEHQSVTCGIARLAFKRPGLVGEKKDVSEGDYKSVNINALKNSCGYRNHLFQGSEILRFSRGVYLRVS
jgi:hypothetical protein